MSGRSTSTILVPPTGPPVRRIQTLPVVDVITSPSGKTLLDFGQNLVGWLRLRLPDAPAGTEITVRHAEVLENGELGHPAAARRGADRRRHSRRQRARGAGSRRFTFHGFRYAEINGWPAEFDAAGCRSRCGAHRPAADRHVHLLGPRRHAAARERRLGNARQFRRRPDRLPAAGRTARLDRRPARSFAPTAAYLYDTAGMLRSWLADLAVEQARQRRRGADVRAVDADVKPPGFPPLRRRRGGVTPPSSSRGCCTRGTATRSFSPTSGTA